MTLYQLHKAILAADFRRNPRWWRTGYTPHQIKAFEAWWKWQVRDIKFD
jgi:hypothetical protein